MWRIIAVMPLLLVGVHSLYLGDSCVLDTRPGTCHELVRCPSLLKVVRAAGTPMPAHIRRRLQAASCGFKANQPLVCCVPEPTSEDDSASPSKPSDWQGDQPYDSHNSHQMHHSPVSNNNDLNQWSTPSNNNQGLLETNTNHNWGHDSGNNAGGYGPHQTTESAWGKPDHNTNHPNDLNNVNNCRPHNNEDSDLFNPRENGVKNQSDRNGPPDVSQHRNLNILPRNCGAIEEDRIWGGNRTSLYEMPWMVLFTYESRRGIQLSCGGTLVTRLYVLTAAHCVSNLGSLRLAGVVLGDHDVRLDPDCERVEGQLQCAPSAQNVTIASVTVHPGYTPQTLVDDIALVRLRNPADFTMDNMKPICLPTTRELQRENLTDVQGIVAGWGATEDGLQSPVLLKVQLPVVGNEECQRIYRGNPRIYDRQLCAGGVQDKDSCGGDSGGPLMYPGRTGSGGGVRYVQRGIVSFGSKRCGVGGFPAVYTRLSHYMDWILDNITDD